MSTRILQHLIFWLLFISLYVTMKMFFAEASDLEYPFLHRAFRFFMAELAFLPWKIIPFYFLFYFLIPRYFRKGQYFKIALLFSGTLIICIFGYRSMLVPVLTGLYGETPDFNIYSLKRLIWTLTDMIPAIGLASSIKLLKGSIASQKKEEALQKEKMKSELNFLKAQTNPHFLFNTLNNIYGLARRKDGHTAPSIMKLSNIMRYILHECSSPTIPIQNELTIIQDYIELEKLRYDDRLKILYTQNIDEMEQEIAPLILLPFIENAFKHGASETRFETSIKIEITLKNKVLTFFIQNTMDDEKNKLSEGIGLKNVKRQLELIYENQYDLKITPAQNNFSVDLKIQLEKK